MRNQEGEARRWLRQAGADLEVVKTLVAAGHYAAACFHSQQAAEKGLKALLYWQGARQVLEHSVQELLEQCVGMEPSLAARRGEAALLDQFYVGTRYPNALPYPAIPGGSYTEEQARRAQEVGESIVGMARAFLVRQGVEGVY